MCAVKGSVRRLYNELGPSDDGELGAAVKKGVAAAAKRAGVKCSPHVLRHTAAVLMADGSKVDFSYHRRDVRYC